MSRRDGYCILTTFNEHALKEFRERYSLPPNKVPFQTENMQATLIYEVGHSTDEIEELFEKNGYRVVSIKGCCYWHVPIPFWDKIAYLYRPWMDALLNLILPLRYAELHLYLMKK